MNSVRVEPTFYGGLLIDVICDCGRNGLKDEATGESSFKHHIKTGANYPTYTGCSSELPKDINLICECGRRYQLHPQNNHIHVFSLGLKKETRK